MKPTVEKGLKVKDQPDRLAAMGIRQTEKIVSAIPNNVRRLICKLFTKVSAPRVAAILQGASEDYFTGQRLQKAFVQCQLDLPGGHRGQQKIADAVRHIAKEDMSEDQYKKAVHIHRSDKTSEKQKGKPVPAHQIAHRSVARSRNNGERRLETGTLFAGGREWTRDELGQFILLADSRDMHVSHDPNSSRYAYLSTEKLAGAMTAYIKEKSPLDNGSSISPRQIIRLRRKLKDVF